MNQPSPICIPDLETAQQEYDAIVSACPADHFQAHGVPSLYRARMDWLDRKERAKTTLDMARTLANSTWKRDGEPIFAKPVNPRRSTIDQLVEEYNADLDSLSRLTPRSTEWVRIRNRAYNHASKIRGRCNEEHIECPALAPVPLPPQREVAA